MMRQPELLAPAGNLEKLQTALLYGADAVYLGGDTFNLRAACDGFSAQELKTGVDAANAQGAVIFYCLNSLPFERDLKGIPAAIEEAADIGVHAFIVADPGILRMVKRYAPHVPVHVSTQVNTTNSEAVAFWVEQGACRVNLARELSSRDIYAIRKALPDVELEVFVHGAMCLALSGQCLLSLWLNNRPANQGRCTQPCRFEYRGTQWCGPGLDNPDVPAGEAFVVTDDHSLVVDESVRRGTDLWHVQQGESYSSFWAPQDLCLLSYLPWFVRNKINSIKIEGRTKGASYVGHVVDVYRTALNAIASGCFSPQPYLEELLYTASRPLSSGFFLPGMRRDITTECLARHADSSVTCRGNEASQSPVRGHALLGKIVEPVGSGAWRVDVRGPWRRDMDIELMLPGLLRPVIPAGSYGLENHRGEMADTLGSGIRAVIHVERDDIVPGVFIRSV